VIEDAAGQCMASLNGMIQGYRRHPKRLALDDQVTLLLVIFTTARLWVSNVNLGGADLATGDLTQQATLKQVDWLYYQCPVSLGMKHDAPPADGRETALSEILRSEYIRTIAVVSALATAKFLQAADPEAW
jgi:hypothetical protein